VWGGCFRSRAFERTDEVSSEEFGKCLVNFTRATRQKGIVYKTIKETCDEYFEKETKRLKEEEYKNMHKQLSLFDE
jgi:hypothetical protein